MTDQMGPKDVLRAMGIARRAGDMEAAVRFIAPESLDQGVPVTREHWRHKWEQMRAGSPGMAVTVEHSMEDGEWIAHRYTMRGTHEADLFGQPPTGERFEITALDMLRIRDGQLVEHWSLAAPLDAR